jgi:flagellar basal-body rod modification protein FlgD
MTSSISAVTGTTATDGTSAAAAATSTQSKAASAAVTTQDQFMKLFIAQLQNQDPLAPQDSSAFLAQLAQMSQLEQSTETNQRLQSLADAQAASARASLSQMVGRTVTASASTLEVRDGTTPLAGSGTQLGVHTDVNAKQLELDFVDSSGRTVKSVDLGSPAAGDMTVDPTKVGTLPVGSYRIVVKGKGADGSDITGSATVTGTVGALQMGDGGDRFRIGPFNVAPANITSVGASTPGA